MKRKPIKKTKPRRPKQGLKKRLRIYKKIMNNKCYELVFDWGKAKQLAIVEMMGKAKYNATTLLLVIIIINLQSL